MPNTARGEQDIPGLGTLRYDWNAIARLIDAFGESFDATLSEAMMKNDLEAVATAVAIGLGGDWTADAVKEASPPIVPTINAVMVALNLSFHGQKEAPPAAAGNPPNRKARRTGSAKRGAKRTDAD